jgi:F-type H+-transporting ATPase subunit epsilon
MDKIALHVLTGEGPVFEKQVEYVNLPTGFGSLGVLAGHADMLCAVEAGILRCRWSDGAARVRVSAGVASVGHNEVNVLVTSGEILEE